MDKKPSCEDLINRIKSLEKECLRIKHFEETLESAAHKYHYLYEGSRDGFVMTDMKGNIIETNPAFREITGYTAEELNTIKYHELTPKKWHYIETDLMKRNSFEKGGSDLYEIGFRRKDDTLIPVEIRTYPVHDDNGEVTGRWSVVRDISKRKDLEEDLRMNEEKFRAIFHTSLDGMLFTAPDGRILAANPAACRLFGYTEEEIRNGGRSLLVDTDDPNFRLFLKERAEKGYYRGELNHVRKDGTKFPCEISSVLFKDKMGNDRTSLIIRDISESRRAEDEKERLEAQLLYAQRMEAIGTLAGGIAHNFNNLLMGIQGNVSIMALEIERDEPGHHNIKNIERLVQNGSKLTAQILGYAREGKYQTRPINLNALIKDTSETFSSTRKEIRVHLDLGSDLFGIIADQGQIEQTLLNLYVNAADAMPQGGELFIATKNTSHNDMKGNKYKPKAGNYVLLTVRDTGVGMDKKTMERIFEPFFTTKGLALGTGLGLASSYGIIKGHGGYIDVDSKPGNGATFSVYLPATDERVAQPYPITDKPIKGDETVLLVDDEDIILDTGEQMLKSLGYRVILARNGLEAIREFRRYKGKISIVLLDMVMPGMGGGDVFDRIKEIDQDVRILLSSGYSIDGKATEILSRGCDAFIQKPFNLRELSGKLREVLDRA